MIRSYSELRRIEKFEDRFEYLALRGEVGCETFGSNRYVNQAFYRSAVWRRIRNHIIIRDSGCDLAVDGYDIHDRPIIHHMNPLSLEELIEGSPDAIDPEFLILTTHRTHNAIHYGDASLLVKQHQPRRPGDTKLW